MPKKWNLQDIRPARPAERPVEPATPATPTRRINQDIAPRRPEPTPETETYDPDLGRLDIVDGNNGGDILRRSWMQLPMEAFCIAADIPTRRLLELVVEGVDGRQ